jgi:TRAP-type C4-dicarboxylate transport system permease small subunit
LGKLLLNANKIWKAESAIAGILLVFNMLLIVVNIILRRFFNAPIFGTTELVRYMSLCVASLALAENEWLDGNIKMNLLFEIMSQKTRDILILFGNVACSIIFLLISYLLILQAISKFAKVDVSMELGLPLWVPSAVLAFGFCALTISIIIKSMILGFALKTGEHVDFNLTNAASNEE